MPQQAGHLQDRLIRAHLIHSPVPDRHAIHDLLRDYARDLAAEDGTDEQRSALTRLFDHCLNSAGVAMQTLFPAESGQRPDLPAATAVATWLTDPDAARAWLAAELPSLVRRISQTATMRPAARTGGDHGNRSATRHVAAAKWARLN